MPDRETVIRGLAEVSEYTRAKADIAGVGKGKEVLNSMFRAAEDAIALLKEQEPVVPESHMPDETCPACGTAFIGELSYYLGHDYKKYYAYCPGCGRKVDWNA